MRLQADLSVNNTVYLDMLNKIQQFRVVRAGAIGNVRIVDYAQVETKPSKPKKTMIVLGSVAGGFVLGVLIIFFLRALSPRGGYRRSFWTHPPAREIRFLCWKIRTIRRAKISVRF